MEEYEIRTLESVNILLKTTPEEDVLWKEMFALGSYILCRVSSERSCHYWYTDTNKNFASYEDTVNKLRDILSDMDIEDFKKYFNIAKQPKIPTIAVVSAEIDKLLHNFDEEAAKETPTEKKPKGKI
jgi:hypothetical protein